MKRGDLRDVPTARDSRVRYANEERGRLQYALHLTTTDEPEHRKHKNDSDKGDSK